MVYAHPVEAKVAGHYASRRLIERIMAGLAAAGVDPAHVRCEDLSPVDAFHIGGAAATADLVGQIALEPGMEALDIGSGLGGTARQVAEATGARVIGLDLTEDYVVVARELSALVGMADCTRFVVGSALAMPFEDRRFDAAFLVHVGMNIADKAALFAEARRVLRAGGAFGVYEVMRTGDGELDYPLPWAAEPATSFVGTIGEYREAARGAGFAITCERERRAFALEYFATSAARMRAEGGPPPLGIHLLMEDRAAKIANMMANIEAGRIAPVEMILRAGD